MKERPVSCSCSMTAMGPPCRGKPRSTMVLNSRFSSLPWWHCVDSQGGWLVLHRDVSLGVSRCAANNGDVHGHAGIEEPFSARHLDHLREDGFGRTVGPPALHPGVYIRPQLYTSEQAWAARPLSSLSLSGAPRHSQRPERPAGCVHDREHRTRSGPARILAAQPAGQMYPAPLGFGKQPTDWGRIIRGSQRTTFGNRMIRVITRK